jgi:hypothetical protein
VPHDGRRAERVPGEGAPGRGRPHAAPLPRAGPYTETCGGVAGLPVPRQHGVSCTSSAAADGLHVPAKAEVLKSADLAKVDPRVARGPRAVEALLENRGTHCSSLSGSTMMVVTNR